LLGPPQAGEPPEVLSHSNFPNQCRRPNPLSSIMPTIVAGDEVPEGLLRLTKASIYDRVQVTDAIEMPWLMRATNRAHNGATALVPPIVVCFTSTHTK
jgi:hypothetical protein